MITTPHMGLVAWDLPEDDFDHTQLAANFLAVDTHDHSSGKGVQIGSAGIADEAVTHNQLGLESVHADNLQSGSITSDLLSPDVLPLGSVITWYRAPGDARLPGGGWEIMDGRPWSSITNSLGYTEGSIPDMRGKFAKGADLAGSLSPSIGEQTGQASVNLTHSHAVDSHSHTVQAHVHGIIYDGSHAHPYHGTSPTPGVYNLFQHHVGIPKGPNPGEYTEAIRLANVPLQSSQLEVPMEPAGMHNHSGNTTVNTPFASGAAAPNTDVKLATVSLSPTNIALLYIMRVR